MASRNRLGSPVGKRLKEARQRAGLSQRLLGIAAGMDESVASPRVNQYERGTHEPSYRTVLQLAKPLKLPAAYFFCEDDDTAKLIYAIATGSDKFRNALKRL